MEYYCIYCAFYFRKIGLLYDNYATIIVFIVLFSPDQISLLYDDYAFSRALDKLLTHIYWANGLVQAHAPWVLAKSSDAESQRHLKTILHVAMETLRICGILLQPVIPVLSDRMLTRLGVSQTDRGIADCKQNSLPILLGSQVLLLNRISASK